MGAGGQETEFKAHSKRQKRGLLAFPRTERPLHSPTSLTPKLLAPAQVHLRPPLLHLLPSSPKRQVAGETKGREEDGSEGQYCDGSASPRPTERPPGEPLWVTSKAHTILHLKSRAGKVKGASPVFSAFCPPD